jgi:hypothetical protein
MNNARECSTLYNTLKKLHIIKYYSTLLHSGAYLTLTHSTKGICTSIGFQFNGCLREGLFPLSLRRTKLIVSSFGMIWVKDKAKRKEGKM